MKTNVRALLFSLGMTLLLCASQTTRCRADDDSMAAQRALFLQARASLQQEKSQDELSPATQNAIAALKNYPLYPYLQLQRFSALLTRGVITDSTATQIDEFLVENDNSVVAEQLRTQWLEALAANGQWQQFLYYYRATPALSGNAAQLGNTNKTLQCEYIDALFHTEQSETALQEIDKLWLSVDLPEACDAPFSRWFTSAHRSEILIWKRLQLALDKNQEAFARFLVVQIREPYKMQAEYSLLLWRNPAAIGDLLPQIIQQPEASTTIALALKNLAKRNFDNALTLWLQTRDAGQLNSNDSDVVRRALGRQQIVQYGVAALPWLLKYDAEGSDTYLLEWRIRLALSTGNWNDIARWITQMPSDSGKGTNWNYWRARALQTQADPALQKQANDLLASIAKERSYYGFLAADILKIPYAFNDEPINTDINLNTIEKHSAVVRAREFFLIGENASARREWQFALRTMSNPEQRAAALLAERWGWYDQSLRSATQSGAYNDVRLRFPLAYRDSMQIAAKNNDLPLSWIFAITRQESAFMADARSPVGALGLMQLMPATAKLVARSEKMRIDNNQLLEPAINIRLGSAYLRELAQKYNNNRILATAAYNGGPNRVSALLREQNSALSADIWIEQIPIRETRDYVQSVLAFSVIYAKQLGQPINLLTNGEREIGQRN